MLTQTSEIAIKALMVISVRQRGQPIAPRRIAEIVGCSPTYLMKTLRSLVKVGILRSQRGARGGVTLAREPETIALLEVVEACQGLIVGNYCQALGPDQMPGVCAFHQAMEQVYAATVGALSQWTLADLTARPGPVDPKLITGQCRMTMRIPLPGDAAEK